MALLGRPALSYKAGSRLGAEGDTVAAGGGHAFAALKRGDGHVEGG